MLSPSISIKEDDLIMQELGNCTTGQKSAGPRWLSVHVGDGVDSEVCHGENVPGVAGAVHEGRQTPTHQGRGVSTHPARLLGG